MRLTEHVHHILKTHLSEGDFVIDATAGNGHDTLFLARAVGATGQILAIDLQADAIKATRQRLADAAQTAQAEVDLRQGDHAELLAAQAKATPGQAAAVVFNLGYLPGGDHTIHTQAPQTLRALDAAAQLLRSGGRLCVTAYRAHPGGEAEAQAVENWMRSKEAEAWTTQCQVPPSKNQPPVLWLAEKPSLS